MKAGLLSVCLPRMDQFTHRRTITSPIVPKRKDACLKHVREGIRDKCFFPCREDGGVMTKEAQEDGTLHILVFDNDFSDNAGSYEMRFRVMRRKEGDSV